MVQGAVPPMQRSLAALILAVLMLASAGVAVADESSNSGSGSSGSSGDSDDKSGSEDNSGSSDDDSGHHDANHTHESGSEDDSSGSSGSGSGDEVPKDCREGDRQACYDYYCHGERRAQHEQRCSEYEAHMERQAFCREHPGDDRCQKMSEQTSNSGPSGGDRQSNDEGRPIPRDDDWDGEEDDLPRGEKLKRAAERCRSHAMAADTAWCDRLNDLASHLLQFRWVEFAADEDHLGIADHSVRGALVLDAVRYLPPEGYSSEDVSADRHGSRISIRMDGDRLDITDSATGLIAFKGKEGSVLLDFPVDAVIYERSNGARVAYGDGRTGMLIADEFEIDNGTVVASKFLSFHVTPAGHADPVAWASGQEHDDEDDDEDDLERKVLRAKGDRRVGAEVRLRMSPEAGGFDTPEVLAFDDMEVTVALPAQAGATSSGGVDGEPEPIRVEFSSELNEGRTVVLDFEPGMLQGEELILRYFDVYPQADGTILETEVVFVQAEGGLVDVLDPTDDGGRPEYWVVEDADGTHIMVSVPHWSIHAVTVQSIGSALVEAGVSVIVGAVAGITGAVLAAAVMLWPRRRDEEA